MGKISRTTLSPKETLPEPINSSQVQAWSLSTQNNFVRCVSLLDQIKSQQLNIVDNTNIVLISYSLALFGDSGKKLFLEICLFQNEFESARLEEVWNQAILKSIYKTPEKFIKLCKDKGLQIKLNDAEGWEYKIRRWGQNARDFTDDLTEDDVKDVREFGFIEIGNCYCFAEFNYKSKVCMLTGESNFVLRILFHINRGKQNKRIVELVNSERKVTLDIETKQLTSLQAFKEFTEGQGNFLFYGTMAQLSRIKTKLFNNEKPSDQIDILGWNKQGKFFAFSNGVYNHQFHPVDEHGIVTLANNNYFIPYHPGTDEASHVNEKKFTYKRSNVSFELWSQLYCKVFGKTGEVALIFAMATMFSDYIFKQRGNFPMLFLYGEGGSGKSRVGIHAQHLWGDPQPPLKLTEKANTDKSKIRKMAQYVNAMTVFEEFSNDLDTAMIKTLTGIYDRFGYERSNLESKFGTETVPINSTAMITGNCYPNDDPLIQRLLLMDYNANVRNEEMNADFDRLEKLNNEGLTEITGRILQLREGFIEQWEHYFRPEFNDFKKLLSESQISVPDRMVENYSVIITTAKILKHLGLELPFEIGGMINFLVDTITAQAEKRDTGSVLQRFWDIVLQLANDNTIRHHREFVLSGDVLFLRFTQIHGSYLEKHARIYRQPGLPRTTLLQKLKDSGMMVTPDSTTKRMGGSNPLSCHEFSYNKLGIDLLTVTQYWDEKR